MKESILAIVPCYNESGNITKLLNEIKEYQPNIDILVINDGSTDDSKSKIQQVRDVKLINLPYNMGIGACVQTGFMWAYHRGYDYLVRLDGDGQHDPKDIETLLGHLVEGRCDYIVGSRYLNKNQEGYNSPLLRRLGIHYLTLLIKLLSGIEVKDPTSGYFGINRKIIEFFVDYYPHDYPEPEAILLASQFNGRVREVPVTMRTRATGISSITPLRSIYYLIKVSLALVLDLNTVKNNK